MHPAAALLHAQRAPLVLWFLDVLRFFFEQGGRREGGRRARRRAGERDEASASPVTRLLFALLPSDRRSRAHGAPTGLPLDRLFGREVREVGRPGRLGGGLVCLGREEREVRTSSSRRFLGRWLAISGGRTTCLLRCFRIFRGGARKGGGVGVVVKKRTCFALLCVPCSLSPPPRARKSETGLRPACAREASPSRGVGRARERESLREREQRKEEGGNERREPNPPPVFERRTDIRTRRQSTSRCTEWTRPPWRFTRS